MSRRRRRAQRGPSSPPFRSWGLVLSAAVVLLLWQRQWIASSWIVAVLIFYMLAVRQTRCRVETIRHRPCRWRVRGTLACCDYHLGLKRGLPRLVPAEGFGLPMFMWPRYDLILGAGEAEPQPLPKARGTAALAPRTRESSIDKIMMWLAVASLAVACASFLRDFLAS